VNGTTNVRFVVKDAATLDEVASYYLITTFDAVHDQAKPATVPKGIADALKNDGVYPMQDIAGSSEVHNNMDYPLCPFLSQGGEGLGSPALEQASFKLLADPVPRSPPAGRRR
jgi:hypothetical protein